MSCQVVLPNSLKEKGKNYLEKGSDGSLSRISSDALGEAG